LGAEGSDGFCSFDGGTLELSGVFGGRPSFASRSADSRHQQSVLRHQRLDPSQKRGDQSVLAAKSGGGVMDRLTHIRDAVARTKSSKIRPSLTP